VRVVGVCEGLRGFLRVVRVVRVDAELNRVVEAKDKHLADKDKQLAEKDRALQAAMAALFSP
jgi:hypothetical protein